MLHIRIEAVDDPRVPISFREGAKPREHEAEHGAAFGAERHARADLAAACVTA